MESSKTWMSKPNFLLVWPNFMVPFFNAVQKCIHEREFRFGKLHKYSPKCCPINSEKPFPLNNTLSWRALNSPGMTFVTNIHTGLFICVTSYLKKEPCNTLLWDLWSTTCITTRKRQLLFQSSKFRFLHKKPENLWSLIAGSLFLTKNTFEVIKLF